MGRTHRAAAALLAGLCAAHVVADDSIVLKVEGGPIRGVVNDKGMWFKGVPYAADTSGANRWMPPQPRAAWPGVLDCTEFRDGCLQVHHNPDVPSSQSEVRTVVPALASAARASPRRRPSVLRATRTA